MRASAVLWLSIILTACGGGGNSSSSPAPVTYTVSAAVSGLSGSGLALTNNGGSNISVTVNGVVTIANGVSANTAYQVAVATQPTSPSQTCSVANGSGSVSASNVSNITVSCVTNSYTVGGNVSNLLGSGLVISNNGTANLPVSGATYAYTLASGSKFSLAFITQPSNPSQTCVFANPPNASGTVGSSNNTSVDIVCTTNSYAVGGTVSGLSGTGLALSLNGGSSLPVSANGTFSFPSAVLSGAAYAVAVAVQPTGANYTCDVAGGTGMVQGGPITNVAVVCGPISGFAYVANSASQNLSAYAINGTTGALSPLTKISTGSSSNGEAPYAIAVTPNKQFLYMSIENGGEVFAFAVNGATGALTAIAGSPFSIGSFLSGMVIDPSGQFLYVVDHGSGSSGIFAYAINPTTGVLAPITGSPFATGSSPFSITITPSGQYVYVANSQGSSISGYALNGTTGVLTPLAGSPFAAATNVYALTMHPNGTLLYAANGSSHSVTGYAINSATGALTAVPGSPFASGTDADSVALDPAGKFLYVGNYLDGTISAYTINSSTGALTVIAGSPFDTGAGAGNKSTYSVDVDPSGAFLYATNGVQGNVSAFTINSVSGALAPIGGGPFPAGSEPIAVVTIP
jgi:6-phosphogluconolactonase (cycloisomerase 2 family)